MKKSIKLKDLGFKKKPTERIIPEMQVGMLETEKLPEKDFLK